jgi:hypothetical protein
MSQFHSFPSVRSDDANWPGEAHLDINQLPFPPSSDPQWSIAPEQFADTPIWGTSAPSFSALDTPTPIREADRFQQLEFPPEPYQTDPHLVQLQRKSTPTPSSAAIGVLHDIETTQSLVAALQSTLGSKTTSTRIPVVIPADKKLKPSKQTGTKQALTIGAERRISVRTRYAIVFVTFVAVIFFSLLSLAPLGAGQNNIPLVSGVVSWVHSQEQSLSVGVHQIVQAQQDQGQGQGVVPIVPAVPVAPQAPNVPASRSQYVMLARMDAIDAGINPDYFVQQINVESGFNPNAVSPSGAVGIAQFLPSTAAGEGVDPWNPISALRGAARLMASYSAQYGGNYAMALAAYNAGGGTVSYAVNLGGAYWMNYLPAETRNYIHNIMGV